jgi:hypothetical protein
MRAFLMASTALILLLTTISTNAATIDYEGNSEGVNIVKLTGDITEGDSDQFIRITTSLAGKTVVLLDSPGGLIGEGLTIGDAIHRSGYATAVPNNTTCASVCGLIWLAGSPRLLTKGSKIGFHAAYRADGTESGQGNAIVGSYLTYLGFSIPAIMFLTESPPDDMKWLHPADATRVGITYSLIESHQQEAEPFIPSPAPTVTAQPRTLSPAEQQVVRLVFGYNAYWSQGGPNVEGLAQYYSPQVIYYGASIPVENVMDEKRKFSLRWPIRHYTVNPSSVFVQCGGGQCSVTGVVAWDCTSQERGEHSVGTANFVYRIVNGVIVSENGAVLSGHKDSVGVSSAAPRVVTTATQPSVASAAERQAASMTTAYAEGRQARIQYEGWFAALPEGLFREGAEYWVNHRSDKSDPPSCSDEDDPTWQTGCSTARKILAPMDFRRRTEKDYWWGWNSL